MKIGLITIQKSQLNYGACLQCYALYKRIKQDFGHCEVIDILRPMLPGYRISRNRPGEMSWRRMLSIYKYMLITSLKKSRAERQRDHRFRMFSDKIEYSACYHSINRLYQHPPTYDVYITGSDQVWSPFLPFVNEPYFLTFTEEGDRRISYASSFGVDTLPENLHDKYRKWLNRYDCLSVRESSGAGIVRNLTKKEAQVVMDPVFLLDREEWRKEENAIEGVAPGSYIFLYMLHYNQAVLEKAEAYAKSRNKTLYFCLSELGKFDAGYGIQIQNAGPAEWLWLIDNADTMVTTSFHGSAFAVIFGKPLAILTKSGIATNTRIENLAQRLGLSDHIHYIEAKEELSARGFSLDQGIGPMLEKEINESILFLQNSINNAKD